MGGAGVWVTGDERQTLDTARQTLESVRPTCVAGSVRNARSHE